MESTSKCYRLQGKKAIVTAATAGIGLAIAERLASEGASVFICSRKQKAVDETVRDLRSKGLDVSGVACHVGDEKARKSFVTAAVQHLGGKIDILISNAAVNPTVGPLSSIPSEAVDKILDINVKSCLSLIQEVLPFMTTKDNNKGSEGGSISLITSVTAFEPQFPISFYAISKTTLLGLVKGLAGELGPSHGIRVNGIAPGIVPTKFAAALVSDPELEKKQIENTFLKRLGRPWDIAAVAAFLSSVDASYVTGETIVVSGGMHSRL